ncbi:MAG: hypothetical protein C0505_03280 [Leptothrix sp. (in: Bacteria)]|nr:hypothetical protein [Leptothrix sp. (in: b-proteobacteria)]
MADEARTRHLHGTELGALLQATALAARLVSPGPEAPAFDADAAVAAAAGLARRSLALAEGTEALHIDRAWRWLAPARALQRAAPVQALAVWQAGQAWVRTTAAAHVPPEFADGFLRHPLHQQLQAPAPGAPPPAQHPAPCV